MLEAVFYLYVLLTDDVSFVLNSLLCGTESLKHESSGETGIADPGVPISYKAFLNGNAGSLDLTFGCYLVVSLVGKNV